MPTTPTESWFTHCTSCVIFIFFASIIKQNYGITVFVSLRRLEHFHVSFHEILNPRNVQIFIFLSGGCQYPILENTEINFLSKVFEFLSLRGKFLKML